ncbi:MAG: membrane protein insertase YidC [Burkholderiales bacterium]|nr:membrane protein insertase YidC [Burkholderiales bacterium]
MTDMRRTLLWVVFVMSLVLLWDAWNKHNGQPSLFGGAPRPAATAASGPPVGSGASAAGVPTPLATTSAGATPTPAAPPGAAPAAAGERVTVTTDLVRATFDTLGGTLVHLELLAYKDLVDPTRPVVLFDRSDKRVYLAQTGLVSSQSGLALPNHLSPMRVTSSEREFSPGHDTLALRFESAGEGGVKLVKTYTFKRGQYTVAVKHEVVNQGSAPVSPQLYLQLARDGSKPEGESSYYFTFTGPAMFTEAGKYKKFDFKDLAKAGAQSHGDTDDGWIAMVQHYFVSAWLLPPPVAREFRTGKVDAAGLPEYYTIAMVESLGEIAPGASKTVEATLMAGPQEEYKLAALAPGLDLVKDYGWLTPLAKPLFWLLDKLHKALGNWGWAIVALVVLLKIAFYWLNASAYRSMAKMKAVAPRVTELRERFKDKPQQMQQEMMRIYREEKVNPLGGCLPIVVQMPFFIALYWVLLSTVEMRQASWFYITDLAQPDTLFGVLPFIHLPLGPLPLLMTASSLFQVWLNPTPPDPMQAKMMWIMPLVFGFMFFFFPAGLVLYWLTNNILSIAQQWFINKKLGVTGK